MPAAAIGAVASIGGAMISADAAGDAADAQVQASSNATAAQRQMFERQVALQQPWRDFGGAGVNQLAYELGLSPTGFYGAGGVPMDTPLETEAQIMARLLPQFQPPPAPTATASSITDDEFGGSLLGGGRLFSRWRDRREARNAPASGFNSPGYEAAVQAELARVRAMQQQRDARVAQAQTDPNYGNLLREFGMADFQRDPGYDFRQGEGEKAMQRAAAAGGLLGSGKYLKDAMRFNQGLATEEYGKAFDRFNVNKTNKFNRLAAVAGIGQTAANQTGAAAANFGSQIGSNMIGAGNAIAAGRVGGANAINAGIGQGVSMYQQNELMNRMFPAGGGGWQPNVSAPSYANSYTAPDYGQYF